MLDVGNIHFLNDAFTRVNAFVKISLPAHFQNWIRKHSWIEKEIATSRYLQQIPSTDRPGPDQALEPLARVSLLQKGGQHHLE